MSNLATLESRGVSQEPQLTTDAALSDSLGTSAGHLRQMSEILDIVDRRRQCYRGEEHLPWSGRETFLRRAVELTRNGEELLFTFPGFPFKSANQNTKVLGSLPDEFERRSLANLNQMLEQMNQVYPGGCRLKIVSDGLPFCDLFKVKEETVCAYYERMCRLASGTNVSFCCMTDLIEEGATVEEKRRILEERYAQPIDVVGQLILQDIETNRYFAGLKHFLVNDLGPLWIDEAATSGSELSKREIQRRAGETARAFIRLNNAFNALLAEALPPSIRLSCHPQRPENPNKVGIELTFGTMAKSWGTPWQNALVRRRDGTWDITRKGEALEQGWTIVNDREGNPSHFVEV